MAEPIVVLNTGEHRDTIISRGDYRIRLFASEVTLEPYPLPEDAPYSLRLNFQYLFGDPNNISAGIQGNSLPLFPPLPMQTPALVAEEQLRLEGMAIDASRVFSQPAYDNEFGDTVPAALAHGTHPFSDFNLKLFTHTGDTAYIAYASSDLSVFGYLQIERVTELDWKLVGYAFEPSGEAITVQKLVVPAPPALTVSIAGLAGLFRRRV